jgi:NADPH-dependent ferric siderophore reductase
MRRLVLTSPELASLEYLPGQDLMFRFPQESRVINRRYTIRSFDRSTSSVTMDVSLHGAGPGTAWVRDAQIGDVIDAIGPRGKIRVVPDAQWHLFIADETGLPGALAMMESLNPPSCALARFEVDNAGDEQPFNVSVAIDLQWLYREGDNETSQLVAAVGAIEFPSEKGHAYIAAESSVVRMIQQILRQRGLQASEISAKAYWRKDRANADHGEPVADE